jgi:hypothetical protein
MWPCFQEGDLLELAPIDFDQVRTGDCIAYSSTSGEQAVHRVVGKKGSGLITRGDALPEPDNGPVFGNQIIGRVMYRHRFGQKCFMPRGLRGQFYGFFYRYAGRIDPKRPSRGGKLARGIRATSSLVFRRLSYVCVARTMKVAGEEKVVVWELKGRIIGREGPGKPEGLMTWPWSIFVQLPEKTD